ncbi:MAG: hypothetical protein M3R17_16955 [Bacteroidota bacterium]|nr:hypothetical protein [Bacteroidota bacterium]
MRINVFVIAVGLFCITGCGDEAQSPGVNDSLSEKEAMKKALQEDLPPSSDIKQFNWFYSAFAHAATTGNDTMFDVVIHPQYGLWIIHSAGAVPNFTRVDHIREFKQPDGKSLLPFERDAMMRVPKEESLPVLECENDKVYNKEGCFTSLQNTFAEQKIWTYSGLPAEKDKEISETASTITRTVINTKNYRYYFSLINGSWYLTFLDIMTPCEA